MSEFNISEMPVVLWEYALHPYSVKCERREEPFGTHTLVVIKNGREVERHVVETTGRDFMRATYELLTIQERWRAQYYPEYIAEIRRRH